MKTSSAKAKGRRLQNWVANCISTVTGIKCGKDELIQGREMGQTGCDVKLIGDAAKAYPFAVECKNTEKWDVGKAIEQAQQNGEKMALTWQVFLSKNRFPPVVVMDAEAWFSLYRELLRWREGNMVKRTR